MMKKKMMLTIAAAGAILMANPASNQAEAATTSPTVYTYQVTNVNDWNRVIESFYKQWASRQVTTTAPTQTTTVPTQPTTSQPTTTAPTQSTATAPSNSTAYSLSAYEQKVVELTNIERSKSGLPALQVDVTLSKVAREKSRDMAANQYFSHTSPTYGSPFDMMKKFGVTYRAAGENIAMGQRSPEEVVKAWMNSEGHRKNILNASFTHIGVGYVAEGNYWTQQFIGK